MHGQNRLTLSSYKCLSLFSYIVMLTDLFHQRAVTMVSYKSYKWSTVCFFFSALKGKDRARNEHCFVN